MRALLARFPQLARTLAHVDLHVSETPVERWNVDGVSLLLKRDDRNAPLLGGNKVRALEFLLAGVGSGDTVLTIGASGSTHALAVAEYARSLGAECQVITWPQETNAVSRATSARLNAVARVTSASSVVAAYLIAAFRRARRRVVWVPAGGSVPIGAIGHVNAALELVAQLQRDARPMPGTIVVPLGSGGTVAGLLVGFAIAGVTARVVGVRVVPSAIANRWHVLRLAGRTRRLLSRLANAPLAAVDASRLEVEQRAYGGAYGRETGEARTAATALRASGGPKLDGTYSAKAFGVALAIARRVPDEDVLFWLTFDGRWLADDDVPTGESDG